MRKFYSQEFKQKVINEYINGTTVLELSNKYDIAQITIYYWLRKNNIKMQRKYKHNILSIDLINQIKDLYINKQLSIYNISKKLNISISSITSLLIKQNIYKPKKCIRYSQEFKQQIINEYINTNISINQLTKKYNINYTTLCRWVSNNEQAKIKSKKLTNIKQQIINEYNNGINCSVSNLARKYNLNRITVRKWILKANNISTLGIADRYSQKFKQQIINEYVNTNISINQLAKKYNLEYTTVYSWLKKNNINIRNSHKKEVNDQDIIQAYNTGLSILQINKKFHISNKYIIKVINTINQN